MRKLGLAVLAVVVVVALAGVGVLRTGHGARSAKGPAHPSAVLEGAGSDGASGPTPNVIFFLTDDLSWNVVPYMKNVLKLERDGTTFTNYYVEQSTCCTSRSTIMTGEYSHNTHVVGNTAPQGGFERFHQLDESKALPVWMSRNPTMQTVGLMGKYLNEYPYPEHYRPKAGESSRGQLGAYVPDGWNEWDVPGDGQAYQQTNYRLNQNGVLQRHRHQTFLDRVLGKRLLTLIGQDGGASWRAGGNFIYDASYAPHLPYAHPPSTDGLFRHVPYPRTPAYNEADTSDKYAAAGRNPLFDKAQQARMAEDFRDRLRAVQVYDRYIGRVVDELRRVGALDDTYLVFSSDNGYHMGEHRLPEGKYTQFQTDVDVPLVVDGPGIAHGRKISDLAGNIDLAETFADMTHTAVPTNVDTDGLSLLPLLEGKVDSLPRRYLLIGRGRIPLYTDNTDDLEEPPEPHVPSKREAVMENFYGVVRRGYKYIQYTHSPDREEFYDERTDPYELDNLLGPGHPPLSPQLEHVVTQMRAALTRLRHCQGQACTISR